MYDRTSSLSSSSDFGRERSCRKELYIFAHCCSFLNRRKCMSRGLPSMTALLGLLAIAGYQNRDKIAEMLGGRGRVGPAQIHKAALVAYLGQLGLGGASAGGVLSGGLGELLERFKQTGQSQSATPGSTPAPISRAPRPTSSGRLARRCWRLCRSKQVSRETSSSRGFAANCPTQSTSTRRKGVCRRKPTFRMHSVMPIDPSSTERGIAIAVGIGT